MESDDGMDLDFFWESEGCRSMIIEVVMILDNTHGGLRALAEDHKKR